MSRRADVWHRNRCAGRRSGHRSWRELSDRQRTTLLVVGSIELSLTATAAVDLYRRPREMVRGHKALWWPAIFVQPVGPVAYLVFGRRHAGQRSPGNVGAGRSREPARTDLGTRERARVMRTQVTSGGAS